MTTEETRPATGRAGTNSEAGKTSSNVEVTGLPRPTETVSTTAFDRLRDALARRECRVNHAGPDRLTAQCPAHDDRHPSLSVTRIDGLALVHCHAGCDNLADVLPALGLRAADLYDSLRGAEYRYPDGRVVHRSPDKRFRQSGNTRGAALYNLDAVRAAVTAGETVYVVEGEKDAHALAVVGAVATCSAMGAGKADRFDWTPLRGATVRVVADRDEPGRQHAVRVRGILNGLGCAVEVLEAATGNDAADHVAAGLGLDEFVPVENEQPEQQAPVRRLVLVSPREVTMRPVRWLWGQRVPVGELNIWAGRAGIGKSQAAVWLSSQVTLGALDGHHHGRPGDVIYATTEDSHEHTVVPRLHAAGADLDRVHLVRVLNPEGVETGLSLAADLDDIRDAITETGAVLVVFDALVSGMSGSDLNSAADVRRVLEPLAHLAHGTGVAVVGIAHFRKAGAGDPLAMVSGSSAFGEVVRSAIGFARDETADDGSCVLSVIKGNLAPGDVPSLRYTIESATVDTDDGPASVGRFRSLGETDASVRELLAENGDHDSEDDRDARGWLHAYLVAQGGAAPPEDVIKDGWKAGYSRDQLKRAKKPKGQYPRVHSRKTGMAGGWVWSLEPPDATITGDTEGNTKETKGAGSQTPLPSHSSALPSAPASDESSGEPSASTGDTAPVDATGGDEPAHCRYCGGPLLHAIPGRETCERCRIDNQGRTA